MAVPATMKALVLREGGYSGKAEGPSIPTLDPWLELADIAVPTPGPGQVLVEVGLANINPSDLHFIKGEYGIARVKGAPAGFEAMGRVVATGEGAERLAGRRVGFIGDVSGAWAQYSLASAASVVPVADGVRDEDAAALFVNPMTAIAMFAEVKKCEGKAFVMTAAASQLCKLIAGLARDEGYEAIAVVRRQEHVSVLKEHGAAHVLVSTDPDYRKQAAAVIRETKPRIMLDAVADQLAADLFFAMPSRARWVIYGKLSAENPVLTQAGQFVFLEKRIEGFWLTKWLRTAPREEVMAAGALVQQRFASGAWKTDVAEIVPLDLAHALLPKAFSGANHGKVMLKP